VKEGNSPEDANENGILQIDSMNPEITPPPPIKKKAINKPTPYSQLMKHVLLDSDSFNVSLNAMKYKNQLHFKQAHQEELD
jgi:hypothetical protein